MQHAASAITAPDSDQLPVYWQFHAAVARAQLADWLPVSRRLLIDISGPRAHAAELAAQAGHTVLRVLSVPPGGRLSGDPLESPALPALPAPPQTKVLPALPQLAGEQAVLANGHGAARNGRRDPGPGRIMPVIADSSRLTFLAEHCADAVIAEDRALSVHLAAETMIADIARVLRPGGRVLACVDSLVLGMAVLADQHHWASLVDLPHAEVVLVPWPDGTITRCYGPDQARELFTGAGLRVRWIRPRTVFSESMVTHWLRRDPGGLPTLIRAELAARSDESLGAQLVISARKPC